MPPWPTEVWKLTPFVYAAAVFGLFKYIDKNASAEAKRAITTWLTPLAIDRVRVAKAILETFDRVYGQPLLGWRAFARSAAISIIVMLAYIFERDWDLFVRLMSFAAGLKLVIACFISNVLSDYLSLFVVRRWLQFAGQKPLLSLITGPMMGVCVVTLLFFLRDYAFIWHMDGLEMEDGILRFIRWWLPFNFKPASPNSLFLIPALAVHSWLPLFAFGVLGVRLLNWLFQAVHWMQWFVKQGQHHPLQAVGYVAGVIVFVVTAGVQLISR